MNTTVVATAAPATAAAAKATSTASSGNSPFDRWDYDPAGVVKESGQHVGLQNQVKRDTATISNLCHLCYRLLQWCC
jgi:hypothetical protein